MDFDFQMMCVLNPVLKLSSGRRQRRSPCVSFPSHIPSIEVDNVALASTLWVDMQVSLQAKMAPCHSACPSVTSPLRMTYQVPADLTNFHGDRRPVTFIRETQLHNVQPTGIGGETCYPRTTLLKTPKYQ